MIINFLASIPFWVFVLLGVGPLPRYSQCQSQTIPKAAYTAYYAPFWIDWGFAMTESRLLEKNAGGIQLILDKENFDRLVRMIVSNKSTGKVNPLRLGLIVLQSDGSCALVMDANGGVRINDEEFGIQPNAFLRISMLLNQIKERNEISKQKEDFSPNLSSSEVKIPIVPDKTTAIRVANVIWSSRYGDFSDKKFRISETTLRNGAWFVRGIKPNSNKGNSVYILISRDNGRILDVGKASTAK